VVAAGGDPAGGTSQAGPSNEGASFEGASFEGASFEGASFEGASFEVLGAAYAAGGRDLLAPLDLVLEPGRFHGLIGHNGSGKSTFLKLLARQERPSRGEVRLGGRPLPAWGHRAFARAVAYLPQATPASTGLTVAELVAFGRYPWHGPLRRPSAADRARVEEALALADLGRFRDRLLDTLSGGERQRAWIAMLVAQDAGFVLLDEPTSALDLAQGAEVMGLLRRLTRERGIGVVAVLHDINAAAAHCDALVALHGGRLLHAGPPGAIMREAVLEDIYGLPMTVVAHPRTGAPVGLPR
jgi:ferric hydroxamate transport system ATP-binding protein